MQKHLELIIFGKHLCELRKAKGFTQESFAHAAGINPHYYGSIERGERNVAYLNQVKMARALNFDDMGELFPPMKKIKTIKS